jgi:hypothetical protein
MSTPFEATQSTEKVEAIYHKDTSGLYSVTVKNKEGDTIFYGEQYPTFYAAIKDVAEKFGDQ